MRTILNQLGDWVGHLAVIGVTLGIVALLMKVAPREDSKGVFILVSPAEYNPACIVCNQGNKHPDPRLVHLRAGSTRRQARGRQPPGVVHHLHRPGFHPS